MGPRKLRPHHLKECHCPEGFPLYAPILGTYIYIYICIYIYIYALVLKSRSPVTWPDVGFVRGGEDHIYISIYIYSQYNPITGDY